MLELLINVSANGETVLKPHELIAIESEDSKAIVAHLKLNSKMMGMTVQYAVNPKTGTAIQLLKAGKIAGREVKELLSAGYTVWGYSLCFASKKLRLQGKDLEFVATFNIEGKAKDNELVNRWINALGA